MKQFFGRILALLLTLTMIPGWALAQSAPTLIVGMVGTAQGQPVPGIRIAARDDAGKVVKEAATDARGQYALPNLAPGRYQLTLDPTNTGYKGETVASAVGAQGLTVNWMVSQVAPALATAAVGTSGSSNSGSSGDVIAGLAVLGGFTVLGLGIYFGTRDSDKRRGGPIASDSL